MALAYADQRSRIDRHLAPVGDVEEKPSVELHVFPSSDNRTPDDDSGELIVATAGDGLRTQGDAPVEVIFAADADRHEVARLLRAMAETLDGSEGERTASLQPALNLSSAVRMVKTFDDRADYLRWRDEQE